MVVHWGRTVGSGHYYAIVLRGEQWFVMNDDKQTAIKSPEAYLKSQSDSRNHTVTMVAYS